MKVTFCEDPRKVLVEKEGGDYKYYNESRLWYAIKREILKKHDVIKKLMVKDGHLTDDTNYYIRMRKPYDGRKKEKSFYCIYDSNHAIRFMYEDFNNGRLWLTII